MFRKETIQDTLTQLLAFSLLTIISPLLSVHAQTLPHSDANKISRSLKTLHSNEQLKVWVMFKDKGFSSERELEDALDGYAAGMSSRARKRRAQRTNLPHPNESDMPIQTSYVNAVLEIGGTLRSESRWLNAIGLEATASELSTISRLPFVTSIDPIIEHMQKVQNLDSPTRFRSHPAPERIAPFGYGDSRTQIQQIQAEILHEKGFFGTNMLVGLLDTGFSLEHSALQHVDVIAQHDFVNDDANAADEIGQDDIGEDEHGSIVLGVIAGNAPGNLMGVAYRASYLLAKTEKVRHNGNEFERLIEEDWWIQGLEWAEAMGADIISSSLGYADWYRFENLDGKTSKLTIAANLAVEKGLTVVVAAGNRGAQPLLDLGLGGRINVPADGFDVLAIGAVDRHGDILPFSSRGPTFDGRIKPDLIAMGGAVRSINPQTQRDFTSTHRGTSMSAPLAAGVATLLLEAFPIATPQDIARVLRATASQSEEPDNTFGYGIIQAHYAYEKLVEDFGNPRQAQPTTIQPGFNSRPTTLAQMKRGVLLQNFPNPFNAETWIPFRLTRASEVTLRIYALNGRSVYVLAIGYLGKGDYSTKARAIYWKGYNLDDEPLPSGIYFYLLDISGERHFRKLTLLE